MSAQTPDERLESIRERHAARLRTRAAKGDGETQMSTLVDDDMRHLLAEVERLTTDVQRVMVASHRYASDREDLQQEVMALEERADHAEADVARRDKVLEEVAVQTKAFERKTQTMSGLFTVATYEDILTRGMGKDWYAALDTSEGAAPSASPHAGEGRPSDVAPWVDMQHTYCEECGDCTDCDPTHCRTGEGT